MCEQKGGMRLDYCNRIVDNIAKRTSFCAATKSVEMGHLFHDKLCGRFVAAVFKFNYVHAGGVVICPNV